MTQQALGKHLWGAATLLRGSIPREERLKVGLTDTLMRLSVGIEDAEDLVADLKNALASI
ncbi:MAG: PLP-dependent transferase [Lewinellaceae bacterium]|nr:PLP-dependent transferase [Saprospiraceae bacterium]MCB9332508.1 PLP-dependent transferase [Lewinellaceae bacterium]